MQQLVTVGFVAPNFQQGPADFNAYYLPYSVGVLWTYASQFEEISSEFKLGPIIWRRDDVPTVVDQLKDSAIIGFSTYVWNKNYNYEVARRIKQERPDVLIVFGGPEPPTEDPAVFERFPFIDLIVNKEGEVTFKEILAAYKDRSFDNITGLLINKSGEMLKTSSRTRLHDLDIIPSPHITGLFDNMMQSNPDVEWNTVLETNRGCPYACTFCDWGSHEYTKIKMFSLERVVDELEWIGQHRIGYISFGDANFGIFPERDSLITDKLVDVQKRFTYPKAYTINWAKNQKKEVVSIIKKLIDNGFRMGLVASVQSLNDTVLTNVKRKNMGINKIEELFEQCDRENIPVTTELILGLPGETLKSWKENYFRLYRANNHTGIVSYNLSLLENSEMNLTQREIYQIKATPVVDYLCGAHLVDPYPEEINIVRSTADMPHEDILEGLVFSWFMNTFHINGLSNILSRFAYKFGTEYKDFYTDLYAFLLKDPWFLTEMTDTRNYYIQWFNDGKITHPLIGTTTVYGMNLGQRTSISIHTENRYDYVFDLLETFYSSRFPEQAKYVDDLFTVQRTYFIRYDSIKEYPIRLQMDYNILGHIQHDSPLDSTTEYLFEFNEDTAMGLTRFCELLWFGRRRNFGKAVITYKDGHT